MYRVAPILQVLFMLKLIMLMAACPPHVQQLAIAGVEDAMDANDKMVASLTVLQSRVKAQRKASLMLAAKTAPTLEDGERQLEAIRASYDPVFASFRRAEVIQNALASGLDIAHEAALNGTQQNMASLLKLYTELHRLYNELANTIGAAGGDS